MSDLQGTQTIIRNMIADYLDISETGNPMELELMGTGFTSLDENPNAQAETRAYISDRTASSIIRGYEVQFPFTTDMIASEKAVTKLYSIGRNLKQAGEAEVNYVRAEVFFPTGVADTHPARRFRTSVEVSDITGEGTQIIEMSGNLNVVGDFTPGVFNVITKTFYPGTMEGNILTVDVAGETVTLVDGLFLPNPSNGTQYAAGFSGSRYSKPETPKDV